MHPTLHSTRKIIDGEVIDITLKTLTSHEDCSVCVYLGRVGTHALNHLLQFRMLKEYYGRNADAYIIVENLRKWNRDIIKDMAPSPSEHLPKRTGAKSRITFLVALTKSLRPEVPSIIAEGAYLYVIFSLYDLIT